MNSQKNEPQSRRELKTRNRAWAQQLGRMLSNAGVSPNFVSLLSIAFSAMVTLSLYFYYLGPSPAWLLLGAAGIQLRLLCNLMDGLIAIEGRKKSPVGDLYNDIPDRIADVLIIVGIGLAIRDQNWAMELAWLCSIGAVLSAYLRYVGASLLGEHRYLGPQAKQHRMALCTVALLITATVHYFSLNPANVLLMALYLMFFGIIITCVRRTLWISQALKKRKLQ
jgi:phosphatidylglycerophosphate synthase